MNNDPRRRNAQNGVPSRQGVPPAQGSAPHPTQRPSVNTQGQRRSPNAPDRRHPSGQGGAHGAPYRPPQYREAPNGQTASAKAAQKKTERNLILAGVLFSLLLVLVIIFGAQSCSNDKDDDYVGDDNVILATTAHEDRKDPATVYAEYTDKSATLEIDSGYGILIDIDSNKVIASKNGDEKIYPASMTKVLTLIVAVENIKDLDGTTYTFDAAMLDELYIANASVAGFKAGETVTARDLLYGAILPSGGDATNALAELVAGSEEDFAVLMNEKVKDLRLKNTHFVTASGLHDDDHYTTCHDMAKMLQYAISKPEMRKILSTYKYTTSKTEQHPEGIELTSTLYSRMKGDEAEGVYVQGGKTGYTIESKNCLCTFAANCREDEASYAPPQYILVTAYGAGDEYIPIYDAIKTYEKYCKS